MTILVLGKSGAGKSSTVNSLLGERAANVSAFQADVTRPTLFARTAAGFTLNVIDTPGLLDGDCVNARAVAAIVKFLQGRSVHVARGPPRVPLSRDAPHALRRPACGGCAEAVLRCPSPARAMRRARRTRGTATYAGRLR